jgi:hypothetical protein
MPISNGSWPFAQGLPHHLAIAKQATVSLKNLCLPV